MLSAWAQSGGRACGWGGHEGTEGLGTLSGPRWHQCPHHTGHGGGTAPCPRAGQCHGCSAGGIPGPAPHLPPQASHGSHTGRGSTAQDRELQRAAGRVPAEITPLIVLLQELRDKRDLQDLPAIQIEFLILAAGGEAGLSPSSARRGTGSRHGASWGLVSSAQEKKYQKKIITRSLGGGGRQPCAGGASPPLPLILASTC